MCIGVSLIALAASFGHTLKYYVKMEDEVARRPTAAVNAFSVLMSSQRQISNQAGFLAPIENPRNKKEELRNAVLKFFEQEHLCWTPSEVANGVAMNTLRILTDVLWVLDGHQATLRERCCVIPVIFNQFANFNRPELSKQRKRSNSSLSSMCIGVNMCIV